MFLHVNMIVIKQTAHTMEFFNSFLNYIQLDIKVIYDIYKIVVQMLKKKIYLVDKF